jgi:hypothetical protein
MAEAILPPADDTTTAAATPLLKRSSLNGCWILDKTRGTPSMRGYLETMGVTELAIEAHEKGESERDTFHTIELDDKRVKITKRSRVNHDLVVDLELGKESVQQLPPPGDRVKRSLAISNGETHLEIRSSLNTMNGMARVLDVKNLVQEEDKTVLLQALTVTNEQMGTTHTTTRYFNPYTETPPHLVEDNDVEMQETTVL